MKRAGLYRRCVLAVALPSVLLLVSRTPLMDAGLDRVLRWRAGGWVVGGLLAVLLWLEGSWLVTLGRFVRVRGRAQAFEALETDPNERARRRRRKFRFAVVAFSTGMSLCLAEVGFRVLDIRPTPPPRLSSYDNDAVDNTLNDLGIRERWNEISPMDKRLRIVVLGDSMVYGFGVEREKTFVHRLQGLLSADWPDGVLTINVGYPGTAPYEQVEKYRAIRDALRPDLVVHVVYLNDLGVQTYPRLKRIYRMRDEAFTLGKTSYLLHYAEQQVRYWLAWRATVDYFRGGRSELERDQAWARFEAGVRACKAAAEQGGATYVMVLFPWLVRLKDYPLTAEHERMRRFAKTLDVPYLDLFEAFAPHYNEPLYISAIDEHPTALGHAIAAERIARFLRDDVLPNHADHVDHQ